VQLWYALQKSQLLDQKSSAADASVTLRDSARVLHIIERLISEIEQTGLYTLGIYRKPGPAARVKQLTNQINSCSGVNAETFAFGCVLECVCSITCSSSSSSSSSSSKLIYTRRIITKQSLMRRWFS